MNNAVATVGATPHANCDSQKKAASSRANSARRKLSRRYALATLSAAPLLISGARRKAMRHAKDGFGFAGWWGVRGLRVRLVTSPMSVERAAMAKPNDPKIGTIRAAQVISLVRKSRLTTLLLAAAAARRPLRSSTNAEENAPISSRPSPRRCQTSDL